MNHSFYNHPQYPRSPQIAEQTLFIQMGFADSIKPNSNTLFQIHDGRWFAAHLALGHWMVTNLYPNRIKLLWALFRKTAHWQGI